MKRSKLIEARRRQKLTQEEVADQAKIARSYYTNIENGIKTPSMNVAKRIADVLNTSVDIFFSITVPKGNGTEVA